MSQEDRRPVSVDLFAGAGGLSLGLEQAGFDVVAMSEYDPVHCAVHARNFPLTSVVCADVTRLSSGDLYEAAARGVAAHGHSGDWDGRIDLVAGGPPCQGFSTMGKRLVDDARNRLVFEFFRLVSELRPRYFLMENVPGMMSGGHKTQVLDSLISEFAAAGYEVVEPPRTLAAADYGVPQARQRLFLLGADRGERPPAYPAPTATARPRHGTGGAGLPPLPDGAPPYGPCVGDAIGDLPDADSFEALRIGEDAVLPPDMVAAMVAGASLYAARMRDIRLDPGDRSYARRWDPALLTGSGRTEHTPTSVARFAATAPGDIEPISRFYRLTEDGLCNTIRAGTGSENGAFTSPRPIHYRWPRVITVREAARLHSFPDWFRLHRTKWHGFREIGNAVPPLLGRAVGRSIAEALGVDPPVPSEVLEPATDALLGFDMEAARRHFGAERDSIPAPRRHPAPRDA